VEYVQHKRAVLSPVTIHEAETPTLPPDERRGAPFGFWIAVVTVVATVVATGWYGTIRTGAERQYMTEEQFRSRHLAGGTSASGVETTGGSIVDEPAPDPVALELRYRGEIPIGLQPFQSTEAFKDALFMDLANTGVPVRSILVDAIVTAPGPDPSHRRPEEAHVEVQLAPADAEAADEALAKTALILGHYVADAHVRLRQVVIQTQYDGDVGFAYITHGSAVRELYEGDRRIRAFLDGLERMPQGTYVVEEDAD
jgi:hypothetical protein